MRGGGAALLLGTSCVLSVALGAVQTVADPGGGTMNLHSDLIFRATGATACRDCHRADPAGRVNGQVLDNALVQELKAKAKGIHGPGRFADCLRCHAGGNKGVEKYRK
ncbi:MAG: exported protein of unknown function, putative Diheme cytochrome c [Nitrospira sp.]|nr:exported protein of unknown function, putative Diheme cytochrome c [Nitrospira sp.]